MEEQESRLRSIRYKVEENSETVEKIVDNIVTKYSQELDAEVDAVKHLLDNSDRLEDNEIEKIVMRLPVFMYYGVNGLENLGVESDMAKAVKLEIFNDRYLKAEGTIQDKTHEAELHTMNEQMVEIAFSRAYRKLRTKIEQADNVFSGAKKVLTKRMQEYELHRGDRFN